MKKYNYFLINIIFFVSLNCEVKGQIIPNDKTYPNTPTKKELPPAGYSSSSLINLIKIRVANSPINNDILFDNADYLKVTEQLQYLDGLARPLQNVAKSASPTGFDIVSPIVYDEFGRERFKYLPYVSATNDGKFKSNPFAEQKSFFESQYQGEQVFYSQTNFEASPLNRPLQSLAPGNSWAGSNRGVGMSYEINDANEVRLWSILPTAGAVPISTTFYNAGELYRSVTTDEHGKKVIEYKDKEEKVILKKVQITETASAGWTAANPHFGWLCTYYVYDDFGLLRFVIPPLAIQKLAKSNFSISFSATAGIEIANNLCFKYEYDARNRMTLKKVPGAGEVLMVYDVRDRLIMTQDANLRNPTNTAATKWLVTQYDQLNRPTKTLLYTNNTSQAAHQTAANTNTNLDYPSAASLATAEMLTETYYDNYAWVPSGIAGISSTINNVFNGVFTTSYNTAPLYAQALVQSNGTKGMVTGTKVKILGTNNYLYNVSFYDEKGRVIQTQSTHHMGGYTINSTQYDFSGKALFTQQYTTSPYHEALSIVTKPTYDAAGRMLKIEKSINGGAYKTTVQNEYNALGQLKTKKLGNDPNNIADPIETLDYTYNIRGWLTGINKEYATDPSQGNSTKWFGMQLSYDYGFSTNQYNGNIAGTIWKSRGSDKQRAYGFNYDEANRLLKGDFAQSGGGTWDKVVNAISTAADYSIMLPIDFTGAAYDFSKNYYDMRQANFLKSDKYFHAKANFQATQRGPGGSFFAEHFSNLREIWDQNVKGYPRWDSEADQKANMYGRNQANFFAPYDFRDALKLYRPPLLPTKY